jgi:hypothetical protein
MTFEELEHSFPNGFHDAAIRELKLDLLQRSIALQMDILTGMPESPNPESYRSGTLRIEPAYLFFVDAPDPKYSFVPNGSHLKVDGSPVKAGQQAVIDRLLAVLPEKATSYRFFLEKWNAFLYLSGGSVDFNWSEHGSSYL